MNAILILFFLQTVFAQELNTFKNLDAVIRDEIRKGTFPGTVVAVGRSKTLHYLKSFGNQEIYPKTVPNTTSTIYDLASLTKPIATATSILILQDQKKLLLTDKLGKFFPSFASTPLAEVTLETLLRHRSGLGAGIAESPGKLFFNLNHENNIKLIFEHPLTSRPGTKFRYSDLGFILLAEVVRLVADKDFGDFVKEEIFTPIGMNRTSFRPIGSSPACDDCAATQKEESEWLKGKVHDPVARAMGGVAGHAGLFSTGEDLSKFAQMVLNCGKAGKNQILSKDSVKKMISYGTLPTGQRRGLGWDIDTVHSMARGTAFPIGSFGHTGYTGTSIWIDPSSKIYVILLTNRVNLQTDNPTNTFRGRIATVAPEILSGEPRPSLAGIKSFCQ